MTLGLAAMIALFVAAILVAGPAALILGPALLAAVPFLFGRYPGERLLRRLAARHGGPRRAPARAVLRAPRSLGVRLSPLASRGASRAPPALA